MSDEEFEAAKAKLEAAIAGFYATTDPEVYVGAWALVTHKETIDLARNNQSMVGLLVKTGQSFPMTRGMLEVALDAERTP